MPRQPAKPSLPFPTSESVDAAKTATPAAPAVKKPAAKPAAQSARKAPPKPAAKVPTKASAATPVVAPTAHSVYPFEIQNKALRKLWQQWQPGEPHDSRISSEPPPAPVNLQKFDPAAKPFSANKGKQHDKDTAAQLATELDGLQNIFYADRSFKLLVILQGMDAAGKDGTLRGVFGQMTPLGVRTVGWKAPTEVEKAHDYL